jgi:hypothetical protein
MALPAQAWPQPSEISRASAPARSIAIRPIDLVHLAKQCLGDENLEREVLGLFDTTIAAYFGRLTGAEIADELGFHLHAMRSASSGVGAWGIVDQVSAAEAKLHANQPLNDETVADIGHAVEEVRSYIASVLGG